MDPFAIYRGFFKFFHFKIQDTSEDVRSSEVKQSIVTGAISVVQGSVPTTSDCSQSQSLSSIITEQQPSVGAFFAKEVI